MKIQVFPPDGAVVGVAVSTSAHGLVVCVTTSERWESFHRQGSCSLEFVESSRGYTPEHQAFRIALDSPREVLVVVSAQDVVEAALLCGLCFSAQDKEQIEFIFVRRDAELHEIAAWQSGA
jgi:hypothetical protein